ncbi:MAG: hypothetical protein H3Z53_01425 [archaeon]|nr:hypothetical protein [archaeon]MCP8313020.1 hypothetical protein [archaeon]
MEENTERVYSYMMTDGKFGAHPYQIAKALNLTEATVIDALMEMERHGKITLRSSNIEWKFKGVKKPK